MSSSLHPEAPSELSLLRNVQRLEDTLKRLQKELQLARARFEAAQAQALVGSWELGAALETSYWSKQMYALFGFDPALGVPPVDEFMQRIRPEDRPLLSSARERALERHESVRVTFRGGTAPTWSRHFEAIFVPEHDEHGQLVGVSGTTQDVTDRMQVQEALRLSQARLEAAQSHARIGSWEFEPATRKQFLSRQMYALLGFDPESDHPSPEDALATVHPDDRVRVATAVRQAIARRAPQHIVHRGDPRSGVAGYFEVSIVPQLDESGEVKLLTGTLQDVTEREKATEALRDSERRMQRLLENSNDLISILDVDGRQRSLRGPYLAMLGHDPAELEGTDVFTGMHPDDIQGFQRALRLAVAQPGMPQRVEYRYRHKRGDWIDLEAVGTSWLNDPVIRGIVVNVRQISERKQSDLERSKLQEQLHQAMKMEAVGRLAGGVAHDFNNLLTVIAGNVELALDDLEPQDPLAQLLTEINEASASASSLTRQLLAFSRRQLIEPKVVNLNELIVGLRKMLGRLIGEDIALELKLSGDLGAVRIDPGQFDQVIVNLAVNARDAMPTGGRLTIETSNVDLDEGYFRVHRDLKPGPFVLLVISDSGEGMTHEVLSHVFEPFFTTKPLGGGTGLGLSVIFGAVKQAGGTIGVYSEPDHGTTFKIYLPRVDAPLQRIENARAGLELIRGTETILLVEDNDSVRELTTTMLRRLGYKTLVASNGKSALALLKSEQPAIDLLLTDLVMPEMSGRELSDEVRRIYPDVAILYCSGYTEDTFVRHGIASESLQFIGKPFTLQQLGLKVRQVLEGHD